MNKHILITMGSAGMCLTLLGCGSAEGLVPVSGRVLYRGEPAAGAAVYFHYADRATAGATSIPSGVVEDDGAFFLTTDGRGAGAPPGAYHILVEWRDASGDGTIPVKNRGKTMLVKRSRVRTGPDRLRGRYFDISKPLLHAEIKSGSNSLGPFELID